MSRQGLGMRGTLACAVARLPLLVPLSSFLVPRSPFLVPPSSFLVPLSSFLSPPSLAHRPVTRSPCLRVSVS